MYTYINKTVMTEGEHRAGISIKFFVHSPGREKGRWCVKRKDLCDVLHRMHVLELFFTLKCV
jgi:hypothetical protein